MTSPSTGAPSVTDPQGSPLHGPALTQTTTPVPDRSLNIQDPNDRHRHYPAPSSYDDESWKDDRLLVAQAPWFQTDVIDDGSIIPRYAIDGWLPGGVPLSIVTSWSWRNQYACVDDDIQFGNRPWTEVRFQFNSRSMAGFDRIRSWVQPRDEDSCVCFHRTQGEIEYATSLASIPSTAIDGWRGRHIVSDEAWVWPKAQLRAEFRYIRKGGLYWRWVHDERRFRSKFGRAIPYQCVTVFSMKDSYFRKAFCGLPNHWRTIEVPMSCAVESPMIFSYRARQLMDPQSGWWVVAYTEFAVKTAAFILMEVYDNFRLWSLSPDMIGAIRSLDLTRALGCVENVRECLALLDVIEGTNYEALPSSWRNRGTRFVESRSPGRCGPGADWVYFDPWARRKVWRDEAESLMRARPRDIPDGHPMGWDFSVVPGGWRAPEVDTGMTEGAAGEGVNEDGFMSGGAPSASHPNPGPAADADLYYSPEPSAPAGDFIDIRRVLRRVGDIPESVVGGTEDVIVGYLQGRLHHG